MNSENKRKHERIQSLNLSYICLDEEENVVKQGMGRTLNISESGILLETHFPIEPQHVVQLTISLEEDLLDLKGKPVHVHSREEGIYEIGIQFVDLDQPAIDLLKKFVSGGGVPRKSSADDK
ncbi:MAG: PilZ domain-containing protein [Desulfobacterales bacterium]